ncbi:MAG TPA: hypothetical protein PKY31_09440, partial [Spirochaetota bacterium]|nr:hypothetical protein [Spirochaetota bacterium]
MSHHIILLRAGARHIVRCASPVCTAKAANIILLVSMAVLLLTSPALPVGDDEFFFRRGLAQYENRMYRF